MKMIIVPVRRDNLHLMANASVKFGLTRSIQWLERVMYDPTVDDLVDDDIRGHMSVRDDGEVVAVQGYYYLSVYFRQMKTFMNTGCIMGVDAKFGEELVCCFDANDKTKKFGIGHVGNSVNSGSSKISKIRNKAVEAPELTRQRRFAVADVTGYLFCALQYVLHLPMPVINFSWRLLWPASWLMAHMQSLFRPCLGYEIRTCKSFKTEQYEKFWRRFLGQNDGLITSRTPERMAWLFDESLKTGTVGFIGAFKNSELCGYVLVRKMRADKGRIFSDYQICDICAIGHDNNCLKALAFAAVSYVGKCGGLRVLITAALPDQPLWLFPAFRHHIVYNHPTFIYRIYKTTDKAIQESINEGKGWFFGPFDGERCLGNEL